MKNMLKDWTVVAFMLVAALVVSCEDKAEEPIGEIDRYEWKNTLAGSIVFMNAYFFTGTCTIDGVPIDFDECWRTMHVGKDTDSSIFINVWIPFDEDLEYAVNFDEVPVTGELMDVRFDCSVNDAEVKILENGDERIGIFEDLNGSVKGHIRRLPFTRDPALPDYDCQMEIKCEFDGRLLEVNITSISSSPFL